MKTIIEQSKNKTIKRLKLHKEVRPFHLRGFNKEKPLMRSRKK